MYLPSMFFVFASAHDITAIPMTINFFSGTENKLEVGAGIIVFNTSRTSVFGLSTDTGTTGIFGTGVIGFRHQPSKGGVIFRIGFTPIFGINGFTPSGGISFGSTF